MGRPINERALAALVLLKENELLDYEGIADRFFQEMEGKAPDRNADEYKQLVKAISQLGYRWSITEMPDNGMRDEQGDLLRKSKGKSAIVLLSSQKRAAWVGCRWHDKLRNTQNDEGVDYFTLGEEYLKKALPEQQASEPEEDPRVQELEQELEVYRRRDQTRAMRRAFMVRMSKIAAIFLVLAMVPVGYTFKVVSEDVFWMFYHQEGPGKAFDYLIAEFTLSEAKFSDMYAMAWSFFVKGKTNEAEFLTEKVLNTPAPLKYKARAYFIQSLIAQKREQFGLARQLNFRAYEFYEKDQNQAGMTAMQIESIRITLNEGNLEKVKNDLDNMVKQLGGETEEIVYLYLNRALRLHDITLIETYAQRLMGMTDKPLFLIGAYRSLAQTATARGQWDIALENVGKALAIDFEKINSPTQGEHNLLVFRCLLRCEELEYVFIEEMLRERAVANGNQELLSRLNDPCTCE